MKNKIYPATGYDAHGIKFFFDHGEGENKKHFTVRFSGKPMLLLEYLYKKRGGKDFMETYESVQRPHEFSTDRELLHKCATDVSELMESLALMSDNDKSPFVIYVNDYSEYR